ncbi:MAG: hypothetical protein E6R04_06460 [Spirochaetes bacterium]|nr:MAG: hypothetical protein E6R04_06460 [Spirochaetota bacterium]
MSAAREAAYRVGDFWRRVKAAGFWFFLGASLSYASVVYAGPTRIEWSSETGLVAELGYQDEMRSQMDALMMSVEE